MEALNRRVLDGAVHPLDLAVGPRMVGLCQAMLDPVGLADHAEAHRPGVDGVSVPWLLGELDAVVGENGMDLVRHGLEQVLQELPGGLSVSCCDELPRANLDVRSIPTKRKSLPSAVCISAMSMWKNPMG